MQAGGYLRRHWFFFLLTAGLCAAVYQAAEMRASLQQRLDSIRSGGVVELALPKTFSPIAGIDSEGRRFEVRFQAAKTLLFVFGPDNAQFAPEMELVNRIEQRGLEGVSVIGVAATARGWADRELWQQARFPVVVVQSAEELEPNSLSFGPAIVLLSRGGHLVKYWIGPGKLEDPKNRSELAEALAVSQL